MIRPHTKRQRDAGGSCPPLHITNLVQPASEDPFLCNQIVAIPWPISNEMQEGTVWRDFSLPAPNKREKGTLPDRQNWERDEKKRNEKTDRTVG